MQSREAVEFRGVTYVRFPEGKSLSRQRYFYPYTNGGRGKRIPGGKGLHVAVWEAHNGPLPAGCHVHHRDGNWSNNAPENLECVTRLEHAARHKGEHTEKLRANMAKAIEAAKAWHASPEGRAWHSENGKRAWASRKPADRICEECAKPWLSMARRDNDRFCSSTCQQRWHYRHKTFFKPAICQECGKSFLRAPSPKGSTCSRRCARLVYWRQRRLREASA
jgi:HNH endonuclease.